MRGRTQTAAAAGASTPKDQGDAKETDVLLDLAPRPRSKSSPELTRYPPAQSRAQSAGLKLVIVLGFGFFLLFSAYNTSQDFATHVSGTTIQRLQARLTFLPGAHAMC